MRYLFCSLTAFGFLCPAIGIARALQQRGHEVAFVSGPSSAPLLELAGLKRLPRGPQDGLSFQITQQGHPVEILRQVRHIERAVETFAPHVLVGQQLTLSAIVAGELYHLPVASIGLASYGWPTSIRPANYPPIYYDNLVANYAEVFTLYQIVCKMLALTSRETSYDETPLIGKLFLLQSVPELEGGASCLPERVHLVGTCEWNPPQQDPELQIWLEEALAADLPIIYLQLGTTFQLASPWPYLAEVLGKRPVRVVASVGRMSRPPGTIPANFFVRDHIAQGQVLPYARAVISSSTTTSVLGAFSQGLPLLLIPGDGGEQADLALRCMQAQAAIGISPTKITHELLSQKLDELLTSAELRLSAQRMRQAFAQAGGPEAAANLLETLGAQ